jgi:hypothetical protein
LLLFEDRMSYNHAYLGTPEHHPVEQNAQLLERRPSRPFHTMLLYGRQNLIVPETSLVCTMKSENADEVQAWYGTHMLHWRASALIAITLIAELPT